MCDGSKCRISRRTMLSGALGVAAGIALGRLPVAFADDKACPVCGCEAGHCNAGIPEHLKCRLATPAERRAIEDRKYKWRMAKIEAQGGTVTTACNEVAGRFAAAMGDRDFILNPKDYSWNHRYMTADQMYDYLGSSARWESVDADNTPAYQGVGRLVLGVIRGEDMDQAHGHVFVVTGGEYTDTGQKLTIFDAALGGSIPRDTVLSKAIRKDYIGSIRYYSPKLP